MGWAGLRIVFRGLEPVPHGEFLWGNLGVVQVAQQHLQGHAVLDQKGGRVLLMSEGQHHC